MTLANSPYLNRAPKTQGEILAIQIRALLLARPESERVISGRGK